MSERTFSCPTAAKQGSRDWEELNFNVLERVVLLLFGDSCFSESKQKCGEKEMSQVKIRGSDPHFKNVWGKFQQ